MHADLSAIQLPCFLWDTRKYASWLDDLARQNQIGNVVVPEERKPVLYGHWTCFQAEKDFDKDAAEEGSEHDRDEPVDEAEIDDDD
jgi:hypothetical protein